MLQMLNRFHPDDIILIHQKGSLMRWQLMELVRSLANSFDQAGLTPGDRVVMLLPNSLELLVAYYACLANGLVAVPANDRLAQHELGRILDHASPRLVISSATLSKHYDLEQKIARRDISLLKDLHQAVPDTPGDHPPFPKWPDSQAAIIFYTSGSTGEPKGAVYSHQTLRNNSKIYRQQFDLNASDRSVLVHCLAHNFVFSQATVPFLDAGGSVQVIDFGNLEQAAAALESGSTFLSLIPWFGARLLEHCKTRRIKAKKLRVCMLGGDRVPAEIFRQCPRVFGIPAAQNIGMTETNTYAVNDGRSETPKPGSAGLPLPGVDIEIREPGGKLRPAGETGEIWVRTPAGMQEYWMDPQQTGETVIDGWIATGDAGHLDTDGFLWFDARNRNIVIRDGDNIYPSEVERAISEHPGVSEVAVVGLPDASHGEIVAAAVVPRPGHFPSLEDLRLFLAPALSEIKIPACLLILDALPLTGTGKVDQEKTRSLLKSSTTPG